jgi:hypothetical protein
MCKTLVDKNVLAVERALSSKCVFDHALIKSRKMYFIPCMYLELILVEKYIFAHLGLDLVS